MGWAVQTTQDAPMRNRAWFADRAEADEYATRFGAQAWVEPAPDPAVTAGLRDRLDDALVKLERALDEREAFDAENRDLRLEIRALERRLEERTTTKEPARTGL